MDMNQETKVTVIDDRLRQEEAETLCRWAAAAFRRFDQRPAY